jgi:hypothetical protein
MTLEDRVQAQRLYVFRRAEELGNVSAACREAGISRARFYALALSWPTWGPNRLSIQLARQGVAIAPSTVYRTLRRVGLGTRLQRLGILEHRSAHRAGALPLALLQAAPSGLLRPSPGCA